MPAAINKVIFRMNRRIVGFSGLFNQIKLFAINIINRNNKALKCFGKRALAVQSAQAIGKVRWIVMPLAHKPLQLADLHRPIVKIMHKGAEIPKAIAWKNLNAFALVKFHHMPGPPFRPQRVIIMWNIERSIQDSARRRSGKNINHVCHRQAGNFFDFRHKMRGDKAAHPAAIVKQDNNSILIGIHSFGNSLLLKIKARIEFFEPIRNH